MARSFSGVREKFRRVHKNQAVNLLQIPIHGQNDIGFLIAIPVKFNESRSTTEFEASKRYG